jgi:tRNA A37 threonylcarbamoyladenosine modification protein TsaB
LDCLVRHGSGFPGLVAPVIDAKQHCYFTALYRGEERLTDYMDADARSIAELLQGTDPVLLTGLDADLLYSELKSIPSLRDRLQLDPCRRKGGARELLALAKLRLAKPDRIETEVFTGPLYLRKSDAELQTLK